LYSKPTNLPWIDPKSKGTFNENDIEWLKKKIQEVTYQEFLIMKDPNKSIIKEGKRQQYCYTQELM
jgi:hypothetical protein